MKQKLAEEKNAVGDGNIVSENYGLAEQNYSDAIDLWPSNALFYGNRCKSCFMLGEYKRALEDSKNAVAIDGNSKMGYEYMARCCLIFGDYDGAERAITSSSRINHHENEYEYLKDLRKMLENYAQRSIDCFYLKKYFDAVLIANEALKMLPESVAFKLFKAKCFFNIGDVKELKKLESAHGVPQADRSYIKATRFYCEGDLVEALSYLDQALTFDLNHDKSFYMKEQISRIHAKKMNGDDMFAARKFRQAIELYTEALDGDMPKNSFVCVLQYSRAKAQSKIGNFYNAIQDCTSALGIWQDNVDALLLRAKCHEYLDNFREAMLDYETLLQKGAVINNLQQFEMMTSKVRNLNVLLNHEKAEKQKCYGDEKYMANQFRAALILYGDAITLWPQNVSFYKDRIECYIKLKDYKAAIEDCQTAVKLDNTFFKDYDRMINCCLIIGDIFGTERAIQKCVEAG
ncbi:dnaJ homolog subfamily C member 7-like [Sitodiplosis mosellana]|uniref:dnaJ homolog subfamily C member 7-like n=1 Tax=Sitodiplosis mosellana TaxID=263140 RepID=UPI002444DAF2|nr:dnaJ homolog subfamily C member 7-like [Sitodiplosis mosellana]